MASLAPVFGNFRAARHANLLKQNLHQLPDLAKVTVLTSKFGSGQAGSRKFCRQMFPPLQYTNPTITFKSVIEKKPITALLQIQFKDGQTKDIEIKGLRDEQILDELVKAKP
eukprot:c1758_g1_i1.p1 GENE.c1758_g1_i1~~c1758_g1_i1.p1  ORF type:complete len:112 (+),score=22.99 c1758_g1_i1:29-364(+)